MNQSFFNRRSFAIIMVAVFLMPFLFMGTKRALQTNRNDIRDWLPSDFPETKTHRWFNEHFPHEQFVLASWDGCTLDDDRLEMLARKLEEFNPNLDDLGIQRKLAGLLQGHGLATRRAIERHGNLASLEGVSPQQALDVERAILQWNSPFKKPVLTGRRLKDELQTRYPELSEKAVLKRLEGSLIDKLGPNQANKPSGKRKTCLVVVLSDSAKGKKLRGTLERIRDLARECLIEPPKPQPAGNFLARAMGAVVTAVKETAFGREAKHEGIYLGGPPVDNVAIDVEGETTLFRLAGLSAAVGLGISWLCFRSFRLTFLIFFCAILAAGIGLSSVYFAGLAMTALKLDRLGSSFGTVDAILLSMPSLVYVLAMSGAIHIVNYYHDAIREHGLDGAPQRALKLGWWPCALAALTTALGLGSLLASDLIPIGKFGIYSAWGVLASLALLFLFLPACLHFFPSREYVKGGPKYFDPQKENTPLMRFWQGVGRRVIRHNILVGAVCLALMGFFIAGLYRIEPSVKLMKLFSDDARIIHDYGWLEEQIGPLVPMEVVVRVDGARCRLNTIQRMRMVRDVEHAIERELKKDVGGALSAATFAPPIGPTSPWAKARLGWDPTDGVTSRRLNGFRNEMREYLQVDKTKAIVDDGWDPTLAELGIARETAERLEAEGLDALSTLEKRGDLATAAGWDPQRAREVKETIVAWRSAHRDPTLDDLRIPSAGEEWDELVPLLQAEQLTTLRSIEQYCGGIVGGDSVGDVMQEQLQSIPGIGPEQATQIAAAADRWRTRHGQELWRISVRVRALTDLDYSVFVDELREKVERILDERYRVLSKEDRADGAQPVEGVSVVYTGLVPLVYKAQHELLAGLYTSLKWAFVLIGLVMVMLLRSPTAGLLSMIPNLFPVVMVFGAMGWLRIKVDAGTMMTASVALGVAVDDTIHFLIWFRRGLDWGRDRKGAVMLAYERCGTAMTQTTLIGGLGLSVFAFSTFTPTQRFGVLMLLLLAAALVGDLIFLPALLSGPVGRFFRASKREKSPKQSPSEDASSGGLDGELPPARRSENTTDGKVDTVHLPHASRSSPSTRSTGVS